MNESREPLNPTFVVPAELKVKWKKLSEEGRKRIFTETLIKQPRRSIILPEAFIADKADEYKNAPLEVCYFVSDPNFQKDLCAAVEAYPG